MQKSVRSLVLHPQLAMFASGSTGNIKQWKSADGIFFQNLSGHNSMVNALAVNEDGVMVSGGELVWIMRNCLPRIIVWFLHMN